MTTNCAPAIGFSVSFKSDGFKDFPNQIIALSFHTIVQITLALN